MELGEIIIWGGLGTIAVITGLLEFARKRGRVSLRVVLLVGLSLAAAFSVGLCTFLWVSGGEGLLQGAAVGAGAFFAMLVVAEIIWRFSGRSIVGEMLGDC